MLLPRSSHLPRLAVATAAALAVLPAFGPRHEGLHASGGSYAVGLDSDGDGLHDALEARLGTVPGLRDSDADGLDDLEEFLLGSDPLVADNLAEFPPEPAVYLDVYAVGDEIVFQLAALNQTSIQNARFSYATHQDFQTVGMGMVSAWMTDPKARASTRPSWQVTTASLVMPRAAFENHPAMALAFTAIVDYVHVGDEIKLTKLDDVLSQVRSDLIVNSQDGQNGGVFPVEPGDQAPSGSSDEVCVQTLVPTGYLPGGQVEYQVSEAKCEPLVGAICLPGCANSVLDTLIGIDILSLIN